MSVLMKRVISLFNNSLILKKGAGIQVMIINNFHNNHKVLYNKNKSTNEIIPFRFNVQRKVKETFLEIIHSYAKEDIARKVQLPFISTALRYMDEFGVNKDLETYKALFNIFPKKVYVPINKYQAMMYHFPKHQDTALAILNKMEANFIIPDYEMQEMIINTFGINSLVIKKCWSMFYWLPKFSEINPWPIPESISPDPKVLAQYALEKISSIDFQTDITIFRTKDVPEAIDDTWVISAMSKSQQELLAVQPTNKSLIVEGPFTIWIDKYSIDYFVLKGDPIKREIVYGEYDDLSDLKIPFWERHHFKIPVTIHEQNDGVYYGLCATGTSTKDSLLSWIRCLQKTNPVLEKIPVTFKLTSVTVQKLHIESDKTTDRKQISQDDMSEQ